MMARAARVASCLAVLCSAATVARAQQVDPYEAEKLKARKAAFPENEASIEAGKQVYLKYCAGCHGDEGKGNGGSAKYFDPRPRDFSKGVFKYRSTKSGELPTDEDLYRVTARGVPATAMPAWGEGKRQLSEKEIWQVVYFVKKMGGEDFGDPDFDPYQAMLPYPEPPPFTPERMARGKELYTEKTKGACLKCHGLAGRGNGAEAGTHKDDWGDMVLPTDQTKAWSYRNGSSVREIYRTFSTGLNGTPMPGYGESLSEDERWDLAYYTHGLIAEFDVQGEPLVSATRRDTIPDDPMDPAWLETKGVDIPLTAQAMVRPRLSVSTLDLVTVRAMYDDDEIVLHLVWHDRSKSIAHEAPPLEPIEDTYIPSKTLWARRKLKLRDSIQVQFPTRTRSDGSLPYFYLGGAGGPVSLWKWFADREEAKESALEERLSNGAQKAPEVRPKGEQTLSGQAFYDDGRWLLTVRRKMAFDRKKDVSFAPGAIVPFAVQAWDGGNGEDGHLCAVSSWRAIRLEAPPPRSAYVAMLIAFGVAELFVLLGVLVARRMRRASSAPQGSRVEEAR